MSLKILHLHVRDNYFRQIVAGSKHHEYRRVCLFWEKRIVNHSFDYIAVYSGYPARNNLERITFRKWNGFNIITIRHEIFDFKPTPVFSIDVSQEIPLLSGHGKWSENTSVLQALNEIVKTISDKGI